MAAALLRRAAWSAPRLLSARLCTAAAPNIQEMVGDNKVVVFMKGTPDAPNCGFSNAVCQILRFHGVNDFASYNVLADEAVRQGVKEHTSWPTIPQVFLGGQFVGGCDIMLEMHKSGELVDELAKVGIQSALAEPEDPPAAGT